MPQKVEPNSIIFFATQKDLHHWLLENHLQAKELWIKMAKKATGIQSINYAQALDEALCFGWIDGIRKTLDDQYFIQRFTPRKARSNWSNVNRQHITRLTKAGLMQPAGLKEVEKAKADGRWAVAYDSPKNSKVPEDFQMELDKNPQAKVFFEKLNSSNRFAFLYRIQTAKKPETRARRITQFIEMLNKNEKFY